MAEKQAQKLKPQHQIVIEEIAKGANQTDAYQKAYPKVKSRKVAQVNASRLLSNAIISEAAQNRINRALNYNNVTPEEVIGSAAFQMRSSIDDVLDEKGVPDLDKARETGAIDVIKELETKVYVDAETGDKEYTYKVKMQPNSEGRKEVANYIGVENFTNKSLTDEDLAVELFRRMIQKRNWSTEDALEGVKSRFPEVDESLLTSNV